MFEWIVFGLICYSLGLATAFAIMIMIIRFALKSVSRGMRPPVV